MPSGTEAALPPKETQAAAAAGRDRGGGSIGLARCQRRECDLLRSAAGGQAAAGWQPTNTLVGALLSARIFIIITRDPFLAGAAGAGCAAPTAVVSGKC